MDQLLQSQEEGHRIWWIVSLFYRSLRRFFREYESYEAKVLKHSRESGIQREVLRLPAAELAGLLDFKSLEGLRDGHIHQLKDLCHLFFRTQDSTDPLDRYVSDIFHEISILKEEHYTVKTYAPQYEKAANDEVELQFILDEAHKMFPQKLRQVRHLFERALARMEHHLPSFGQNRIFIRSLYLHRHGFVSEIYPDGLRDFYRLIYPCGPLEGFYQVGLSFYHSGFFPEARKALLEAEAEYTEAARGCHSDLLRRAIPPHATVSSLALGPAPAGKKVGSAAPPAAASDSAAAAASPRERLEAGRGVSGGGVSSGGVSSGGASGAGAAGTSGLAKAAAARILQAVRAKLRRLASRLDGAPGELQSPSHAG